MASKSLGEMTYIYAFIKNDGSLWLTEEEIIYALTIQAEISPVLSRDETLGVIKEKEEIWRTAHTRGRQYRKLAFEWIEKGLRIGSKIKIKGKKGHYTLATLQLDGRFEVRGQEGYTYSILRLEELL